MKSKLPLLSVVVCTRDRAQLLDRCLRSLAAQKSKRYPFEIIPVHDTSKDHNISAVRNRAWRRTRAKYVAYIDDDSVAGKDWIKNIYNFIGRHPEIGIFGGPYKSDTSVQSWLPKESVELHNGTKEKELSIGREWLSATNLIIRKDVLARLHGFDEKLTFPDGSFVFGEETKLLSDAKNNGIKVYYVPRISVIHHTDSKKYSLRWQLQKYFRLGRSIVYVHNRKDTIWYHTASLCDKLVRFVYWTVYPVPMPVKRRVFLAVHGLYSWAGAFAVWTGLVRGCLGRTYEKNKKAA